MFSQAVTIFYIPAIKVQGSGFPFVITAHILFLSLLFRILAILAGVKLVSHGLDG